MLNSTARNTDLAALPLFAQALVAARLARRAVLAMAGPRELAALLAACDVIESITRRGDGWDALLPEFAALKGMPRTRSNEAALEAVRWAFDSAGAAQGALDFPVDSVVTHSARRCVQAVCLDPRISAIQIKIIVDADVDQISFACGEVSIGTYDGLTEHIFGRLAPCHALTLTAPRRSPEEEYR